jgi:cellulose synthase/poly-beta-1,6-N-acetylglucosamine synthase-like glycosyltransferase
MASDHPEQVGSAACELPVGDSARRRGLTRGQGLAVGALTLALLAGALAAPSATATLIVWSGWVLFCWMAVFRAAACLISLARPLAPPPPPSWPRYTVVAPLRGEAEVVAGLIARLDALTYPRDRLQGLILVEPDDPETVAAALAAPRPGWIEVRVAPPGEPRTKPRALNVALGWATGELITVYDAEDAPDPGQLREAASRFAAAGPALACLQAPLRIRTRGGGRETFVHGQFAAEYAALFEILLPALARLGWPFPLGGTSNHFRVDALRRAGGWDAWNVTEDADLGFRLWRKGYRLGVLTRPTYEPPPADVTAWVPQRTRWLKGYMQTLGVQLRHPLALGWRGLLALTFTLVQTLLAAALYAVTAAWTVWLLALWATTGLTPLAPVGGFVTVAAGVASAWLACAVGCRRAGRPYGLKLMLSAPGYWALQSLAMAHAVVRLVRQPFAWDKTPHGLADVAVHARPSPLDEAPAPALGGADAPARFRPVPAYYPAVGGLRPARQRRRAQA